MRAGDTAWVIYACQTPYATEVAEIVWRRGETVARLVDNLEAGPRSCALGPTVAPAELTAEDRALPTIIPLLTPGYRWDVASEARRVGVSSFPPLVDPTATIARTAELLPGVVVNAAAVVGGRTRLGEFVHVNRSASIGHDVEIAPFATVGPGCVLSGSVQVASGAFLGSGTVCAPHVSIGANAVVGAGAVVVEDVDPSSVVVGNPARAVKRGIAGYADVSVPGG